MGISAQSFGRGLSHVVWLNVIGLSLLGLVLYCGLHLVTRCRRKSTVTAPIVYPPVESLSDFSFQAQAPKLYRPFKEKYNLTMSLRSAEISEMVEMDSNYLERIELRKKIMTEHPQHVLAAHPSVQPSVDEFYTWLVGTYLPTRYPSDFYVSPGEKGTTTRCLFCPATRREFPLQPCTAAIDTLRLMGELLDEDFLFMLPTEDGTSYSLRGFVACFPNGFDWKNKFNMSLGQIHKPIPGYKQRLESSMENFFARLQPNKYYTRLNWSITATERLFAIGGNHLYEGDKDIIEESIDPNIARLRVERQFLHRVPNAGAVVFAIKTYTYPIKDIKAEGLNLEFAESIEGLKAGNTPGMHWYKKAPVWQKSLLSYLRA